MMYASLTGPLIGLYFPLPYEDEEENRVLLSESKLSKLWCAIYTEAQVNEMIKDHGGMKLGKRYAMNLL